MKAFRGTLVALASLAVAVVLIGSSGVPAAAQVPPPRPQLIVTVTGPDFAASATQASYTTLIKNDGTRRARNVVVTITIPTPPGTTFVPSSCKMMVIDEGTPLIPCTPGLLANGVMTANLGGIRAHDTLRVTVKVNMPTVSASGACGPQTPCTVTVSARANGDDVNDDGADTTTPVVAGSSVKYLPSERIEAIACGDTLGPEDFLTDTTAQLLGNIGCTSGTWGLRITASEKTLDLNSYKIRWPDTALTKGSVGILVSNALGVTIIGGKTTGESGIEYFDYCVKDEGPSRRLSIFSLRCFRARTAGIDIASKNAKVTGVKIDRVVGTTTTTNELPGGVGIRTRADKALITDSTVLRTSTVGIWASGLDTDGDGVVAQIVDSLIDASVGIGVLLDEGPHRVKDTDVKGDDLPVTDVAKPKDGVVVGPTGIGNRLDGVIVKKHGGNGFVINGTDTDLSRSEVEAIRLDGYVVAGSGSVVRGNSATEARHGFIVSGPATCTPGPVCTLLDTNSANNLAGDGYVVTGAGASLVNNDAQGNDGAAYRISADAGNYETNNAERNADGFLITGSNNIFKGNNTAEGNDGVGFRVSGSGNNFNTSAASNNDGPWEWEIGPGQTGGTGNKVNGSTFLIPAGGGKFNSPLGP